ncbi:MAG: hypothetical protein K5683_09060 [Prevotella sp.]|nr:hypothetical protein [Prevotella sp.]
MSNLKEIPVAYIVEKAKSQPTLEAALPYRTLIADWYSDHHQQMMGYADLKEIDSHFHQDDEEMAMLLPACVVGHIRNNADSVNMLVAIVHEIHRRMNIPMAESKKARRPEDVRQDNWNWPLVMRVMKREDIIAQKTNKATFGMLIEQILGEKVKANSIRRSNNNDFSVVDKYDYELKTEEKDSYREIFTLFIPLLKPKD